MTWVGKFWFKLIQFKCKKYNNQIPYFKTGSPAFLSLVAIPGMFLSFWFSYVFSRRKRLGRNLGLCPVSFFSKTWENSHRQPRARWEPCKAVIFKCVLKNTTLISTKFTLNASHQKTIYAYTHKSTWDLNGRTKCRFCYSVYNVMVLSAQCPVLNMVPYTESVHM